MATRRDFIIVVLIVFCLTVTLLARIFTIGSPTISYNPWMDVNNDGRVDAKDVALTIKYYGTSGTPITKASIEYDSGWINITDKAGQYFNITHNLNSTDIMVDITGKTIVNGGIHQRHLGLTGYTPGWSKTYGGAYGDSARSVIQTIDGGYAIAGSTTSYGGSGDFYLVKTDAAGNMQWNKTYGDLFNPDSAYCVVQTSDGGYALAGCLWVSGYENCKMVKTDSSGNMQWYRGYGLSVSGESCAYSIIQTSDGGYALAGRLDRSFPNPDQAFLIKTNATGHKVWDRTYTWMGCAYSVVQLSNGNYALAGESCLLMTDPNGIMMWFKQYPGVVAFSMIPTSDGGYALAGFRNNDFLLGKTDSSGNMQWNKTYGGIGYDYAYSLVQATDGGYALAGYTNSSGAGNYDFWLVKTNANGNLQWDKVYGGISIDYAYSLVKTNDGGYALAGFTNSSGAGSYDFWLVKTDTQSGVGLAWTDSTANSITLYRGAIDTYWNFVRVRIWKIKETP